MSHPASTETHQNPTSEPLTSNRDESDEMTDPTTDARELLAAITPGPWIQVGFGNIHRAPAGEHPPVAKTWNRSNGAFVAAAPQIVTDLLAEIDRLRDGLQRVEQFARLQALSDRVRANSEERHWLDLLALLERAEGPDRLTWPAGARITVEEA